MTTSRKPAAVYLLASQPYPPVSGDKRRSVNLIEALSRHYTVTVVAADDPSSGSEGWSAASERFVRRRRARVALVSDLVEGIIRGWPALLTRSVRAGLPAAFRSILEERRPELVLLGRPLLGPYLDAATEIGARVAIEADESMPKVALALARSRQAPLLQRARALVEAAFILGRLERSAYPRADHVWVASEREVEDFSTFVSRDRLGVIPNVIDLPDVKPPGVPVAAVAFLGWYPYPPNEAAALELMQDVMPAIRGAGGPRRLVLIGPAPTRAMVQMGAKDPEVELLGEVLEVRPHLRSAGLLLVPIRSGGGTRVKILEAIAAGIPVVSTSLGMAGLELQPDRDLLVAETPAEFAAHVLRLTEDRELRERLTQSAFDQVRARYSVEVLQRTVASALTRHGSSSTPPFSRS